jgi:hypothetical protein
VVVEETLRPEEREKWKRSGEDVSSGCVREVRRTCIDTQGTAKKRVKK